jgi:murein endopeptidase
MILALIALRCALAGQSADLVPPPHLAAPAPAADAADDSDADGEDTGSEEAESESLDPGPGAPGIRYTRDLSDEELQRLWQNDLPSLGTISVGFADQGRLINAVHMPKSDAWICQRPDLAWGTQETVEALATAFRTVHDRFPDSAPARLSHIGLQDGGYLRPHRSHQSGRDADIALFYKGDAAPGGRARREKFIDPARNWALLRALITRTDVQVILVDRAIQKVLRDYAIAAGEDRQWVERIFRPDKRALVQHARKHRDHFHVRFYSPRSQELGRRIQPLLAQRPDQNLALHRVKRGQTLGHIARQYTTTVSAIQKANRLRGTFLHLDQRLLVPLRKPCTKCPLPPPVVVPARFLPPAADPPGANVVSASMGAAPTEAGADAAEAR